MTDIFEIKWRVRCLFIPPSFVVHHEKLRFEGTVDGDWFD